MKNIIIVLAVLVMLGALVPLGSAVHAIEATSAQPGYDIAINNGFVIDPISGFQGLANVGVKDGKIATITPFSQKLPGARVIDATGLTVSPGFINVHGHSTGTQMADHLYLQDGITTDISGNCGATTIGKATKTQEPFSEAAKNARSFSEVTSIWEKEGMYINVSTYVGHRTLREMVGVTNRRASATAVQLEKMKELLRQDMKDGSLGVTFGPFYLPGATYEEMLALARVAAEYGGGSASHLRDAFTAKGAADSVNEGIRIARDAKIPFLLSHVSACPGYIPRSAGQIMDAFYAARADGVKIGMDAYPYDVTAIVTTSAVFEIPIEILLGVVEAKMTDFEVAYPVVIDGKTYMQAGEKYKSVEQFKYVLKKVQNKEIVDPKIKMPFFNPPAKFAIWMTNPYLMIENDSYVWYDDKTGKFVGDPINVGSFAKFLGQRVRQEGACDWRTAIARVSSHAATFLGLDKKGRVQTGCDADITIFDAAKIIDKSTYENIGTPSEGIPYVIVNGVLAVDNGKITGAKAGKLIKRTWKVPGDYANLGSLPSYNVADLNR